ncbi:hypothetical protein [Nonomuraea sp. NPDC003804]|uniref:hypothetical protein n=1 Tax=Nonomuraea sp. NPDC003804 TaxID=3154547 RepID=UPI0033A8BDD2
MSSLHDIAPFPSVHDATAKSIGAHYAALALLHHTLAMDHLDPRKDRDAYHRSANMAILAYGVAHLLHAFAEIPGRGDEAALELWQDTMNPPAFGPQLWEWLAGAGVNPAEVVKAAAEAAQAEQSGGQS